MILDPERIKELFARIEAKDAWRREVMPGEHEALVLMFEAFERLKELGWRDSHYAPRDSRPLELIEIGSTGVHRGHCRERPASDFPTTWFWIEDGDLWPSKPILFREPLNLKREAT